MAYARAVGEAPAVATVPKFTSRTRDVAALVLARHGPLSKEQLLGCLQQFVQQAGEELKPLATSLRELLDSAEPVSRLGTLLCNNRAYQGDEATQPADASSAFLSSNQRPREDTDSAVFDCIRSPSSHAVL